MREVIRQLLNSGAKAIAICLLQSHKNPISERKVRDIVKDELKMLSSSIPVFASADYYSSRKESHRVSTTVLEAYVVKPSIQALQKVSDRFKKHGTKFDLRVMGQRMGYYKLEGKRASRNIVSGPVGGRYWIQAIRRSARM